MLKIFSFIQKRDDAGAAALAEFAKANQSDGITLFLVPEAVAPDQEAIDRIQADTVNWRGELAKAIQKEAFGQAAEIKGKISENDNLLAHVRDSGMTWLKEAMGDAWSFTQVFVLGGEYFPDAKSYPPTVGEFMQHVAQLSATLTSTGLCGAPAHRTPLQARVFVPIGSVSGYAHGNIVREMTSRAVEFLSSHGHPMVAREVPQEDSYTRHSPGGRMFEQLAEREAAEGVVREPVILPLDPDAGPFIQENSNPSSPTLIPDKVKDLNSDEKRVAEKLLEGLAVKRAADACGMSWQSISKTLKPSIVAKFAEAGLDFDALYEKAKTERSEKSEE